jgi:hypothetical protein
VISETDYIVDKARATARFAGVEIPLRTAASREELSALHPQAANIVLRRDGGDVLGQHHSILRHIAGLAPHVRLMGESDIQAAEVICYYITSL